MIYDDVLKIIDDADNIVLQECVVVRDGISNVNYVLLNKQYGRVLSIWGCGVMNVPDWAINVLVVKGEIVNLSQKQMLTAFNKISYKYAMSNKINKMYVQRHR